MARNHSGTEALSMPSRLEYRQSWEDLARRKQVQAAEIFLALSSRNVYSVEYRQDFDFEPAAKQSDNLKRSQTFTVLKEQNINLLSSEDASKNCHRVSIVNLVQYCETKLKTAQQESTQCQFLLAEAQSKVTVLEKDLKEKDDELAKLREAVKCPIGRLTYKEYQECSPEHMQSKRVAVKKWFSKICREGLPSSPNTIQPDIHPNIRPAGYSRTEYSAGQMIIIIVKHFLLTQLKLRC